MLRNLDKHQKYKTAYKANEIYWGLGIEHETYIETSKLKQVSLRELKENRKPERYCVNYYNIYTPEKLDEAITSYFENKQDKILIPILANSHTFQKTDLNGEHKTTYERIPKPNPKFTGQTIIEWMKLQNPDVFLNEYEKSFMFDGDTIEFMTQHFYNATISNVIEELIMIENKFINTLNSLKSDKGILKTYTPFQIAKENYPFAAYLTNLKNNAMFNNGTIHINITLPTQLNDKAEIVDFDKFKEEHQNYARAIQWISPLLVAKYGTPDPLCESKSNGILYAAGSQRVAVSRYIGLGTYDTDKMEIGKINTKPRKELDNIDWYESFHRKTDYKFLDELGMDFNFNKHFCHGLEFRILESISYIQLKEVLEILVHLADFSLNNNLSNPKKSAVWHRIAENCVHHGKGYLIDVTDQNELFSIFNIKYLSKEPMLAPDVLLVIINDLLKEYENGKCVQAMIRGIKPIDKKPIKTEELIRPCEREVPVVKHNSWCCF